MVKITFVVAQIAFKVVIITSSMLKITFVVTQITFKMVVITGQAHICSGLNILQSGCDHFISGQEQFVVA